MNFASDNWAGAHPEIAANLVRHAESFASAYGTSKLDKVVEDQFCEVFEREVAVFFVGTGTAANALALTTVNRPGGVVFCHREAHMMEDECGAAEYLTGGARLQPVDGAYGRVDHFELAGSVDRFSPDFVHAGQPMAVSITQATEIGTVYGLDDIRAIAELCHERGLPLHMDGARFANALVSLGATPAEMSWKQGVDIVSFGGTKNGCWCAEALVFMNPATAKQVPFIRKRAAHLFSKARFVAAQFEAYFKDDLWLEMARRANAAAAKLADRIRGSRKIRLAWEPDANEVFALMEHQTAKVLTAEGATFHDWHPPRFYSGTIGENEILCRFVTSFATSEEEVDRFSRLIA
jgi:threonine aldolase